MEYTVSWPNGGSNKMHEPMHIEIDLGITTSAVIKGFTWTRDGSQIVVCDEEGDKIGDHSSTYHNDYNYHHAMAKKAAEDLNTFFELADKNVVINPNDLTAAMKELRSKCESRYGNRIPDTDYEVLISFV